MNTLEINFAPVADGVCHTHPSICARTTGKVMTYRLERPPVNCHSRVMFASCDWGWTPIKSHVLREAEPNNAGETVLEDARLFYYDGKLHYHATDRDRIGIGEVDTNRFAWLRVDGVQKNWQFFEWHGQLYGIQWICPHTVWSISLNYKTGHVAFDPLVSNAFHWQYGEPRGGTCPVRYGDIFVSVFHSSIYTQFHPAPTEHPSNIGLNPNEPGKFYFGAAYAFAAHPPFKIVMRPKEPLIWPRIYRPEMRAPNGFDVVFPCGLIRSGDFWTCSWGDDKRGFISEFSTDELLDTLIDVQPYTRPQRREAVHSTENPSCLIIINSHKSRELLNDTLNNVRQAKHPDSRLAVVDDHTWFWKPPAGLDYCWRPRRHLGVGLARRFSLLCALTTKHDLCVVMDNDMQVTKGFDTDMVNLWLEYRHRHPGCIASPYRAETAEHLARDLDLGPYVFSTATAGCMLILDRPAIERLLRQMPKYCWTDYWDWLLCGFINGCIKPRITYGRHVGQDKWAVHKGL